MSDAYMLGFHIGSAVLVVYLVSLMIHDIWKKK